MQIRKSIGKITFSQTKTIAHNFIFFPFKKGRGVHYIPVNRHLVEDESGITGLKNTFRIRFSSSFQNLVNIYVKFLQGNAKRERGEPEKLK